MKIAVACVGNALDDRVARQFGRCPFFLIVDSQTGAFEAVANPGALVSSGAGPVAVNELVSRGVQIALAGEFGPKVQRALDVAGVRSVSASGTVMEALSALGN